MNEEHLTKILEDHVSWLNDNGGMRADLKNISLAGANLTSADLTSANLIGVNLTGADLTNANLAGIDLTDADLEWANLTDANLTDANLKDISLKWANLKGANLSDANLTDANLKGANLSDANLDYASWPLWCGSIGVKIDTRISKQLVYHAMCNLSEEDKKEFLADPIAFANGFHRVLSGECEELAK